jgi:UDP-N-acetylmuramoyl-tripeptide--D-alanyl-D-alanine ligase
MKALPTSQIAEFCGGVLHHAAGCRLITRVSTDSRNINEGDLFVALVGEKFDAHDFIPNIAEKAAAIIVSRMPENAASLPCVFIEVKDTLAALQQLATRYRTWHGAKVIGITGSNGKTSTKDLTRAVMSAGFTTTATIGNLNNHIGVPISVLRIGEQDQCAILEMGMNHPGEIKVLADIARPDAAIITNIGVAHIEYMGSREAIALEKGTLAEAIRADGVVVLNANDEFTPSIAKRCVARVMTAGVGKGDVAALDLRADAQGTAFTLDFSGEKVSTHLPIPGEHMVGNAALAAATGFHSGLSPEAIAEALRSVKLTGGRLETKIVRGVTFLDDSYNANPDSMRAGLKTLAGLKTSARHVAVLGRMGELGIHAEREHRDLGSFAAGLGLDALFSVGGSEAALISDAATAVETRHFPDHASCAAHLRDWLRDGDIVLLKGSRSAGMEKVLSLYQA